MDFFHNIIKNLRIKKALFKFGIHDTNRYLNNSMVLNVFATQERMLGLIVARQHVVEKGLTMPETRLGFGQENIIELVKLCEIYQEKYDISHEQFRSVIAVLKEYLEYHRNRSFKLNESFQQTIVNFTNKYPDVSPSLQKETTSEAFFKNAEASFPNFANSRHSVRNYTDEEIPIFMIEKAVDLAKSAPSACNRQPVRVHVCCGKKKEAVINVQKGNRGFGNLANKVLVITSDLSSYMNVMERNCGFVDGGIFVMNLLYALHYFHIGACTLNWSVSIKEDEILRSILDLPKQEEVICLICIGMLPKELKIAKSDRIMTERIMTVHE